MQVEDLERRIKEAFPDKPYNARINEYPKDQIHYIDFEVYVDFDDKRYLRYNFIEKKMEISNYKNGTSRYDNVYFKTDNQELINDEEFILKILRHPKCFQK